MMLSVGLPRTRQDDPLNAAAQLTGLTAGMASACQLQTKPVLHAFRDLMDRIGNLQLLLDAENNEKRAKDFGQWLKTRDADFRKRHLIPDDSNLLTFDTFEQFLQEREKLIVAKLKGTIASSAAKV